MNKILIPFLLVIVTFGLTYFFNNSNPRKNYEQYLLERYSEIKSLPMKKGDKKEFDNPKQAVLHEFIMTADPAIGRVPTERLLPAFKKTQEIRSKLKHNKSTTWTNIPSNMGGRTRAMMWDPNDTQGKKVWAGSVTGGLWYNNNITSSSSSWVPISDFWDNLSISCITYDPNNTNVFYAGTGEAQTAIIIYRESSGRGSGIFKSTDGGQTWNLLESTINFAYVTDMVVRNENGNSVIYAGVVSGIYKGTAFESVPGDGLYRSADGGTTWTQVLPNIPGETKPFAVSDIELAANGKIFVGTSNNLNGVGGATILYSNAGTTGTWTVNSTYNAMILADPDYNIPDRVILAAAPSDSNRVYALIGAGSNSIMMSGYSDHIGKFILSSNNGGASWEEKSLPPDAYGNNWAYLCWHALTAAVDPNNANRLIVGGLDLNLSTDGGSTWNSISNWALMYYGGGDEYVHGDQHKILFKKNSSSEAIFGSDGGVFYTSTANNSSPVFYERDNNYNTLQFYTCAIDYIQGSTQYVGGIQDNGTLIFQGIPFTPIDMLSGGDGAFCFFDENESDMAITSYYDNQYYVFYGGGNYNAINQYSCGLFQNPVDYDSQNNTMYCNAMDPSGNNQDQLCRIFGLPENISGDFISLNTGTTVPYSHIKVSPYSQNTIFVGTQSGRLFKVVNVDGTPSVTEIGSGSFPTANISCIAIGSSDNDLLVTFSNYGVSKIWLSYNGGTSWTEKTGNLPDIPVRWAIFHPQNYNQAMIATELGVWTTNELGEATTNWYPAVDGLANVRVDMLRIRESDNTVLAATHGRGMFTTTFVNDPFTKATNIFADKGISVFPNPSDGIFNIKSNDPVTEISVTTLNGKEIYNVNGMNKTVFQVQLKGCFPGTYILQVKTSTDKYSQKVLIQK